MPFNSAPLRPITDEDAETYARDGEHDALEGDPVLLRRNLREGASKDKRYWLFSPNAGKLIKPPDRLPHPDGEALRSDPNLRFLRWSMQPGDILVVHPWTMHYSHGNPTDDWRIAISVRVFGDDIRFAPRPDCVNLAGVSLDEMIEGEKPDGPRFPLLYSADGRRDDDSEFPRGFATHWTRERRTDVNEYETFVQSLKAPRTQEPG